MIHRNRGNRRWMDAQKAKSKKAKCQAIWGDADTYKKFDGMYDKGKIHDEEPDRKTNQKKYKGKGVGGCDERGVGIRGGAHDMVKAHRAGKNYSASDRRRFDSTESQQEELTL